MPKKRKELIVCAFLLSSLKTYLIYNTTNHNITISQYTQKLFFKIKTFNTILMYWTDYMNRVCGVMFSVLAMNAISRGLHPSNFKNQ